MSEIQTTSNGNKIIANPAEIWTANDFRERMASEYGFDGNTPKDRTDRLRELSVEGVAILLEDINKSLQGSGDSLVSHDEAVPVGGRELIQPEHRYDVFRQLVEDIRSCPEDTSPARIGDALALGVVMMHPFHDGNGRTARAIGLLFNEDYDAPDFETAYAEVTESRDVARERGGRLVMGYIPRMPADASQSNPGDVSRYLGSLLYNEESTYTGTFGVADLKS